MTTARDEWQTTKDLVFESHVTDLLELPNVSYYETSSSPIYFWGRQVRPQAAFITQVSQNVWLETTFPSCPHSAIYAPAIESHIHVAYLTFDTRTPCSASGPVSQLTTFSRRSHLAISTPATGSRIQAAYLSFGAKTSSSVPEPAAIFHSSPTPFLRIQTPSL